MRPLHKSCLWFLLIASLSLAASASDLRVPQTVTAGEKFTINTSGGGKATLYIVGPSQVLRRTIKLGESVTFDSNDLHSAGHYTVVLAGPSDNETAQMDVIPSLSPASISFLAKPARLPVNVQDAISGVVYVFDVFHNLIDQPGEVSFQLSVPGGATQSRNVSTQNGVAWIKMSSAPKAGMASFMARTGSIGAIRIVQQAPGDACNLKFTAHESHTGISLETDPLRDCSGNALPDGTIVSFTESCDGKQATVDVPIKRGIARTDMPAYPGAIISAATGVVMSSELHWGDRK